MTRHRGFLLLTLVVTVSCLLNTIHAASKPEPLPTVTIPTSFAGQDAEPYSMPSEWWIQFGDANLSALIQDAILNNRDVALARARLLESRASLRSAKQEILPRVNLGIGFTDSTRSNNSPAIPQLSEADRPEGLPDLIPRRYGVFEAGFDASYELDLFGAQRAGVKAAHFDEVAQHEELRDTLISVTAELARHYWTMREAQVRLRLARRTEQSYLDSIHLSEIRKQAGLSDESDCLRFRRQLATARAATAQLIGTKEQSVYAIAALTGKARSELMHLDQNEVELPTLSQRLPAGLPSELLQRRPDIRQAAALLRSATARRRSAEKDWFPRFKLTSSTGGQSGELTNLLSAGSFFSNFAPKVTWGILQFQQTRANISRQTAREKQQLAILDATMLSALRDVDTALSSILRERQKLSTLEEALAMGRNETTLARERYTAGLTNYLHVLEAERGEIVTSEEIAESRATLAKAIISLHKALGGGWQTVAEVP